MTLRFQFKLCVSSQLIFKKCLLGCRKYVLERKKIVLIGHVTLTKEHGILNAAIFVSGLNSANHTLNCTPLVNTKCYIYFSCIFIH